MAFTLTITDSDGTDSVSIANTIEWTPASAARSNAYVQESIKFRLYAADLATLRNSIRLINQLINQANYRCEYHCGLKVYLQFNADGTGGQTYRSEIVQGELLPDPGIMQKAQLGIAKFLIYTLNVVRRNYWENTTLSTLGVAGYNYNLPSYWRIYNSYAHTAVTDEVIDATPNGVIKDFSGTLAHYPIKFSLTTNYLAVTHTYLSEQHTAQADTVGNIVLPGYVVSGTINPITGAWAISYANPPTSGTNITATYDYGNSNSVMFDSTSVTGDLPTPLSMTLQNNVGVATGVAEIWLGLSQLNTSADTGGMPWHLEAENSTGSTSTADTSCSAGYRGDYALATDTEALMYDWTLTAAQVKALGGRNYKCLGRWTSAANTTDIADIKYRWKVEGDSNSVLWAGDQITVDSSISKIIRELGNVQIPPWTIPTSINPYPLHLVLYGQRLAGTTPICSLDFLALLPTDSFRKIEFVGMPIENNFNLVYDGNDDISDYQVNVDSTSANADLQYGNVVAYGSPLMLMPNHYHRLVMITAKEGNNDAPIDSYLDVILAQFRPRVVNL